MRLNLLISRALKKVALFLVKKTMTVFILYLCLIFSLVNSAQFGHDFLQYYEMDENYMNLNFGSYGLPPIQVLQNQSNWRTQMESNPGAILYKIHVNEYNNDI